MLDLHADRTSVSRNDLAVIRTGTAALTTGNLRRMADYCRSLAENRCSTEARDTLLRMARLYDLRAAEEAVGAAVKAG